MIINHTTPSSVYRPRPVLTQPASDDSHRIDAFYSGTATTATWISRINGALLGGVGGFFVGALVGAAVFGPQGSAMGALLTTGLLAGGGALGGYVAMDRASDFAARVGGGLDESNPRRGEVLGRVGLNAGISLLTGDWRTAAWETAISVGGGGIAYALAEK